MEIERKFKVNKIPSEIEIYKKINIEQGYLCIKPTIRIRKSNDEYTLNYKWKNINITEQKAIQNIEYEMPLTKENYEHLYNKIDNHMIIKTRYEIPINFVQPDWLGEDISFDKRYDNTLLSKIDYYNEKDFE